MSKRFKLLFAVAAVLGCAATLICAVKKPRPMRWAVGSDEFCPACGNPVFSQYPRCGSCGAWLIFRRR